MPKVICHNQQCSFYCIVTILLLCSYLFSCRQSMEKNTIPFYLQKVSDTVKPLLNKAYVVQDSDAVAAIPYYKKAQSLAKYVDDKPAQARIYRNLVFITSVYQNDFERALAISDSSLVFAKAVNDPNTLCDLYGVRSVVYQVAGKTNEAVEASTMALKYMEEDTAPDSLKNYPLYINVASLYIDLGNYHLANENANKFLKHYADKNDTTRMILAYQTLAKSAYEGNDTVQLLLHGQMAWHLLQTQPSCPYAEQVYSLLAAMYQAKQQYDSAKYFVQKDFDFYSQDKQPDYYVNLTQMTEIAYKSKDTLYAQEILSHGLPLEDLSALPLANKKNLYDGYYKILRMTGNDKMANAFLEKAYWLAADLRKQEINKDLEKYEIERKKAMQENLLLSKELQLNRKNNTISIIVISAFLLIVAGGALFISYKRKLQLQKGRTKLLEEEKIWEKTRAALEGQLNERNRISQELHDELGATLTSITLAAEVLKADQKVEQPEVDIIADRASEMAEKMNEIVWSLNAGNDNLQSLVSYIRKFSAGFLSEAGLKLQFNETLQEPLKEVKGNVRREIYLTVKEAVHNIVKHANATKVFMNISENESLFISIRDNGKGIDEKSFYAGNGLKNMRKRIENLDGSIEWMYNDGTEVKLKIPL